MAAGFVFLYFFIVPLCWYAVSERQVLLFFAGGLEIIAGLREARVGQSPIPIDYGQPLFLWLSRDCTYASTDCTGGVGGTIKRKGGVSQACLGKSTSFILDIHNMVN